MIIPDINLLIYAHDSTSSFHEKSIEWWRTCLTGTEPIGLPHVVAFGFVRIVTNPRAFVNPLTATQATALVRSWLEQPPVQVLDPGPSHFRRTLDHLETLGVAGNLVSDAQLAAIAMEFDAVLHTADSDFVRFPGLRWLNPLTGLGSAQLKQRKGR